MTYQGLSMNTILPTSDMWQYSMLPFSIAPSVAYPQDSLSSLNDQKLFKFNCYADNMLKQTTLTNQFVDSWAQQFNARLTQWYQNMMNNLAFNTKVTGLPGVGCSCNCGNAGQTGSVTGTGSSNGVIPEKKELDNNLVWQIMQRLGNIDTYGEKFRESVTLKDKTKSTYVDRLVQLCKDYVTDNELGLTDSEFATCKEAAKKILESGKIDQSDYKALKAIVENHLGKKEKAEGEDDGNDDGNKEDKQVVRPDKYLQAYADAEAGNPNNYKALSEEFYQMLYNSDATEHDMTRVTKHIKKWNVLNVAKDFKDNYGALEDENIIDAIFADTSRWGSEDWYIDSKNDDAKPSVTKFSEALIARAKDIIERNPSMDKDTKKELESMYKKLDAHIKEKDVNEYSFWKSVDIKSEFKQNVSESFQALADKLQEVENDIYGELDV